MAVLGGRAFSYGRGSPVKSLAAHPAAGPPVARALAFAAPRFCKVPRELDFVKSLRTDARDPAFVKSLRFCKVTGAPVLATFEEFSLEAAHLGK